MKNCWFFCVVLLSPSSRAEWVEINQYIGGVPFQVSPSSRAEWVEILPCRSISPPGQGLRPRGRSGLKLYVVKSASYSAVSPSSRAEWVEIINSVYSSNT